MEFLVHMEVVGPIENKETLPALLNQEAARARELAVQGILKRLWRIPGRRANWRIWTASTIDELHPSTRLPAPISLSLHHRSSARFPSERSAKSSELAAHYLSGLPGCHIREAVVFSYPLPSG
jgi:muconolactone delta-isomerase